MPDDIRIDFLGAAGTVTGSRHLLTCGNTRLLVDCGLFQGRGEIRDLNWQPFRVDPKSIDAIIITHAHIDHIGYLPRLVREGFSGPIYSTPATLAIAQLALPDSAHLQEEEARDHNRHNSSIHKPAMPLYTVEDAYEALKLFQRKPYHEWIEVAPGFQFRYLNAGHILGSAYVQLALPTGETILYSGDLGRFHTPMIKDPEYVEYADYLFIESTYGDRLHPPIQDVHPLLEAVIKRTFARGGVVLVPAFAVGRSQEILYFIHELIESGRLQPFPVYLDSPMAVNATRIYADFTEEHDLEMGEHMDEHNPLRGDNVHYISDREDSKRLNKVRGSAMIISASGMCNGGRIIHHLANRLSDPANTVLFVGFQAEGTLGRRLIDGEEQVRIFGQEIDVRCEIARIDALSAHADYKEILDWLGHFKKAPNMTFIVHGEPPAAAALKEKIKLEYGWPTRVPYFGDEYTLPPASPQKGAGSAG